MLQLSTGRLIHDTMTYLLLYYSLTINPLSHDNQNDYCFNHQVKHHFSIRSINHGANLALASPQEEGAASAAGPA